MLVTGAAKRIGRALRSPSPRRGANVAITYLGSQPEAEATVRALAALDVDALPSAAIFATLRASRQRCPP